MTPHEFIAKWRASALKERSAAQEHFINLCQLLGEAYCFERGARKDTGGGWADVWKRHHFAWEGTVKLISLAAFSPPAATAKSLIISL